MRIRGENLQRETVLAIGKFSILWNCFERNWCCNNCTPRRIKEVWREIPMDMDRQRQLAEVINERRAWFCQSVMNYVCDSLHPENARMSVEEDLEIMRRFLEQEGDDLACGCLLAIHRIRNNLVHGLKLIQDLDGQIELFQAANEVLESI